VKVAERPDLLTVIVVGTGVSLVGYVVSFLASGVLATWLYNVQQVALDPNSAWILAVFEVITWPTLLAIAIGGRIYEGSTAVVSAAAASLVALTLHYAALLLLPDGVVLGLLVSVVVFAVLGASSIAGETRRGVGGAIGGALAGLLLGLVELGMAAVLEWAKAKFSIGVETPAAVELSTFLIQGVLAGAVFWTLVSVGERVADR